jgi:multiple RNA-binding domain-containing protein 1
VDDQESAVLFIKNLNFETKRETLEDLFKKFGEIRKFTLLKGYGFVEFSSLKNAIEAKNQINNQIVDQHQVVVQFSKIEKKPVDDKTKIDLKFRKLIVKNLAFEATKQDLTQLFSQFGELKVVRVPQKVNGGNRGFAFVEFTSSKECQNAYEALKHNHLYGRHLVLEIAEDDPTNSKKREREEEIFTKNKK